MKTRDPEVGDVVECLSIPDQEKYSPWNHNSAREQVGNRGKICEIRKWNKQAKAVYFNGQRGLSNCWPLDCLKIITPVKPLEKDEIDLIWEKKL